MKLCKDCKHFSSTGDCGHSSALYRDPVDGSLHQYGARIMRQFSTGCGADAKLHEPRAEEAA